MDRTGLRWSILLVIFGVGWSAVNIAPWASAEVRLQRASTSNRGVSFGENSFPPSRFGEEPADPFRREFKRGPASLPQDEDFHPSTTQSESEQDSLDPHVSAITESSSRVAVVSDRVKGVQEISLIAGDLGFFPKTVFVTRDIPVRLYVTGTSKNNLCIMMDSFQVHRQLKNQKIEEITFTPKMPGRFRFYCPVNGQEGMMVVKELASDFEPAESQRVPASRY